MFFVISGFLITTLLLDERERFGAFSFLRFYLRRLLRIAPAYLFFLVVMLVWRGKSALATFGICLAYLSDYAIAFGWPGFDTAFSVTWSLSVEEQFYLAWPLVLLLGMRRRLLVVCLLILAVIVWRAVLVGAGASWLRLYFAFDTRVDSMLIGCAVAIYRRRPRLRLGAAVLGAPVWAIGLLVAGSAATLHYFIGRNVWFWCGRLPVHNALIGLLILILLENTRSPISRVLGSRVMVVIGRLSYALYLWHEFATAKVHAFADQANQHAPAGFSRQAIATEAACFVGSLLLAALSHLLIERPFLKLKGRLTSGQRATTGPVAIARQ